jgi:hypothetical protein
MRRREPTTTTSFFSGIYVPTANWDLLTPQLAAESERVDRKKTLSSLTQSDGGDEKAGGRRKEGKAATSRHLRSPL